MGYLIKQAVIHVGLVKIDSNTAKRLTSVFVSNTSHDPGEFKVFKLDSLDECVEAAQSGRINAICLGMESFHTREVTAFISEIRVTCPLIPIALVASSEFFKSLTDYHEAWRERFTHYYKVKTDEIADFDVNATVLRDLFLADSIKTTGLTRYETTPGTPIQLKSAEHYQFKLNIAAVIIAAVIGGLVGPVTDRVFPKTEVQPRAEIGQQQPRGG
nr:hypothetical protein [Pseudomonas sp. A46]